MIQLNDYAGTVLENYQDYEFYKEGKYSILKRKYTEFKYLLSGEIGWGLVYFSSYQYYSTEERDRDFKYIQNMKYNYLLTSGQEITKEKLAALGFQLEVNEISEVMVYHLGIPYEDPNISIDVDDLEAWIWWKYDNINLQFETIKEVEQFIKHIKTFK